MIILRIVYKIIKTYKLLHKKCFIDLIEFANKILTKVLNKSLEKQLKIYIFFKIFKLNCIYNHKIFSNLIVIKKF